MNTHALSLAFAVVSGAIAQLFLKQAMALLWCKEALCSFGLLLPQYDGLLFLTSGIGLYLISILLWIFALKKYQLNYAYPMLACGYVIVYLGAALPPWSESLTTQKTLGVLLVVAGVTLSAQHTFFDRSRR